MMRPRWLLAWTLATACVRDPASGSSLRLCADVPDGHYRVRACEASAHEDFDIVGAVPSELSIILASMGPQLSQREVALSFDGWSWAEALVLVIALENDAKRLVDTSGRVLRLGSRFPIPTGPPPTCTQLVVVTDGGRVSAMEMPFADYRSSYGGVPGPGQEPDRYRILGQEGCITGSIPQELPCAGVSVWSYPSNSASHVLKVADAYVAELQPAATSLNVSSVSPREWPYRCGDETETAEVGEMQIVPNAARP